MFALAVHPTAPLLFSGAYDRLLKAWDVSAPPKSAKGKGVVPHQSFLGHSDAVTAAVIAGHVMVTADAADCLLFWRVSDDLPTHQARDLSQAASSHLLCPLQPPPSRG